jgi:hypothetical protein
MIYSSEFLKSRCWWAIFLLETQKESISLLFTVLRGLCILWLTLPAHITQAPASIFTSPSLHLTLLPSSYEDPVLALGSVE